VGYHCDGSHENITAAGNRFDDVPIFAQRPAQQRYLHSQVRLFHQRGGPDALHNLIPAYKLAARLDKRHQKIKGPAADIDRPAFGEELARARQKAKSPEMNDRITGATADLAVRGDPQVRTIYELAREVLRDRLLLHDSSPRDRKTSMGVILDSIAASLQVQV
jgi:hypothetical protein